MNIEDVLGSIIVELNKLEVPVIVKGAVALQLYLNHKKYSKSFRHTKDLDLQWIGSVPGIEELSDIIEKAARKVNPNFSVSVKRHHSSDGSVSAGLFISDEEQDIFTSVDIDVKQNPFHHIILQYKGVKVSSSSPLQMVADKLLTISSEHLLRRAKDLFDLYVLTDEETYSSFDLAEVISASGKELGNFLVFTSRKDDLEYAYNKLSRIDRKPEFTEVYRHLLSFVAPFRTGSYKKFILVWKDGAWRKKE